MKIVNDIKKDINYGVYKPGKKIPSIRSLSNKYGCSKNTVIKAYDTLKNNHIIYPSPKSGYYIVENLMQTSDNKSSIINFHTGNTIIGQMNTPDLKHCLNWAADIYKNNSLASEFSGIPSLKEMVISYLTDFQVFTSPNNVFINMGIWQALNILTTMDFPNGGDTILVEQPSYAIYINDLKVTGKKVIGINRDESGIDLKELERIFKEENIKFFYTIPRNHNPLGTTLKKSQRKAIARLANKYNVYIVEDDYFGDIYSEESYDPIYSYSSFNNTIYLRSFSKIMPWMRVGIIVVPSNLIEIFKSFITKTYYCTYFSASLLSQATLEIYLRSKILKKHSDFIYKDLKDKYKCLNNGLRKLEKYGIKINYEQNGFYKFIELPPTINEQILVKELEKENVIVSTSERHFLNGYEKSGIRISIASVNKDEIKRGLDIIDNKIGQLINKE